MFNRLVKGLRYTFTLLTALTTGPQRAVLGQMIDFSRYLPSQFDQPLPVMMARLTPNERMNKLVDGAASPLLATDQIRNLADAIAAWHISSPLGICLRRSLLRYHFLRRAGLPVQIVFGARLKSNQEGGGIGGHAWLTLDGVPYYERPQDYAGFAQMFVYPPADKTAKTTPEIPNPKS